jgi:hypothetical protein
LALIGLIFMNGNFFLSKKKLEGKLSRIEHQIRKVQITVQLRIGAKDQITTIFNPLSSATALF